MKPETKATSDVVRMIADCEATCLSAIFEIGVSVGVSEARRGEGEVVVEGFFCLPFVLRSWPGKA